jgi:uncharacterized protein YjbI with pentapeptide repeats
VLRGADCRQVSFCDADLRGADLRGALLDGAWFWKSDLRGADLEGAMLGGAMVLESDCRGATGVNVEEMAAVTVDQLPLFQGAPVS